MKTLNTYSIIFFLAFITACSDNGSRRPETTETLLNRSREIVSVQRHNSPNTQNQIEGRELFHNNIMVILPLTKKIAIINQQGEIIQTFNTRQSIRSAAWSMNGSRAVFLTSGENNRKIISIIGLNDGLSMEMESKNISSPAISNHGDFIAYTSYNGNEFRLHIVPLNSRENRSVFSLQTEGISQSELLSRSRPVISHNGRLVAFSCYTGTGFNIFVRDNEKNITRNLTQQEGTFVEPVFSPGGKYVAYLSREESTQIFLIRSDGRGRKRLTFNPGAKRSISFSPNGKKIVFVSQYKKISRIYTVDLNGDDLTVLRSTREKITGCKFLTNSTIIFQTTKGVFTLSTGNNRTKRLMNGNFSFIALPGR